MQRCSVDACRRTPWRSASSWSSGMSHPCYRRRRPWATTSRDSRIRIRTRIVWSLTFHGAESLGKPTPYHPLPSSSVPRGDRFWSRNWSCGFFPSLQCRGAHKVDAMQGSTLRQTMHPDLCMAYALRYQMIWRAQHKEQDLRTLLKEQTRPSRCHQTLHKRRDTPLRMVGAQTPGEGLTAPTQSFHLEDGAKFPGRYRCSLRQSASRERGSNVARGVDQGEARARAWYSLGRSVVDSASCCRRRQRRQGGIVCSQTHGVSRGRRRADLTR